MHRTLRDTATLLRHHGLTRWSLLLLPALLLVLTAPLQPEGAGMEAVRFLGFGLALVPLARMISILVDELSEHLGDRYSGVVSVGLSNLVELVISITALGSGLYSLVVVSVAGAVITNCLLVLGVSTIWAGRRQKKVKIRPHSTNLQARQLLLSLLFLAVPTVFGIGEGIQPMAGTNALDRFAVYSLIVALLILGYYLLSFLLQLGTHRTFFNAEADDILQADGVEAAETDRSHLPRLPAILAAMAVVSVLVVLVSEPLVDALETLVQGSHLSELFIGLFLLPLFGCTAEGVIAISAASRGRMDLAVTSTLESSGQLLMFVLPVLVLLGWPMGRFLHLSIPLVALGCTTITVLAVHWITENNELDWYEGVQLVALYGVMGLGSLLL